MSLSGSLSNALSGLTAAARAAEVVSSNVANSMTEGYGRRQVELASQTVGGDGAGVSVRSVYRTVDHRIIAERRLADADLGRNSAATAFLTRLETTIGTPDDPGSLTGRIATLEANLLEASSRPDSGPRLDAAVDSAKGLALHIAGASNDIQQLRMEADQEIHRLVGTLNDGLSKISTLNHNIHVQLGAGHDATALMDQRQKLVDSLAQIVPLREAARDGGQIALYTPGGAILLDGKAAQIGFSAAGVIVPQMSIGSGALSGLTVNGQPIAVTPGGPLDGGSLAEMFEIRDVRAPDAQIGLDAVARDLIERFANPSVDPTLTPTDAGLFTDGGGAFVAANELGLAARISVNALVDPAAGGQTWRMRDGLNALAPGNVGSAYTLNALVGALTANRVPASGSFGGAARSASGLSGDFLSSINADKRSAEANQSSSISQVDTLKTIELQSGVDTDAEMQNLLLIEQAYSANARVIATADEMIQTLLGL